MPNRATVELSLEQLSRESREKTSRTVHCVIHSCKLKALLAKSTEDENRRGLEIIAGGVYGTFKPIFLNTGSVSYFISRKVAKKLLLMPKSTICDIEATHGQTTKIEMVFSCFDRIVPRSNRAH